MKEEGSRCSCIRKISRAIFLPERALSAAPLASRERETRLGDGREKKNAIRKRGPVALSDARNSIKRVKSDGGGLSSPKVRKVGASRRSRSFDCCVVTWWTFMLGCWENTCCGYPGGRVQHRVRRVVFFVRKLYKLKIRKYFNRKLNYFWVERIIARGRSKDICERVYGKKCSCI